MDLNQDSSEKKEEASQDHQPQAKPLSPLMQRVMESQGKKFYMPKFHMPDFKAKFAEYGRVLKITKKPDMPEFKAIVKASGLGMIIIGLVGFVIAIIVQLAGLS
jgi:protein transport protein SEC61 subunit gamma-like protein